MCQILDDQETDTFTSWGLQWLGASRNTANTIDAVISIVGSMGCSLLSVASKLEGGGTLLSKVGSLFTSDAADKAISGLSDDAKLGLEESGFWKLPAESKLFATDLLVDAGKIPAQTVAGRAVTSIGLWRTGPTGLANIGIGLSGSVSGVVGGINASVPKDN
jgi:hypothetical protein